jgi:hypothetical protein
VPNVVVVTGRRRPHEVMLLAASAIVGVAYLLGAAPPPSTLEQILVERAGWVRPLWYGLLAASGLLGLVGCWLPDQVTGMLLERTAMLLSTAAILMWVLAIWWVAGAPGFGGLAFFALWGTANVWRSAQITGDLRRMRAGGR